MSILAPKLAMLDTGTIAQAVASPGDLHVKELRTGLRSGEWIPYVTWHHLEELVSHENNDVVRRRFEFFEGLPHVAYLKQTREGPNVGAAMDVRDCEIAYLADHPGASHADVIQVVWPEVRSGFCTGGEFIAANLEWWLFFRAFCADQTRLQKEEIANVTQFPTTDITERLPDKGRSPPTNSIQESRRQFARMTGKLKRQIEAHGDCRHLDPEAIALKLMREAYQDSVSLVENGGDHVEAMLKRDGVSRDRLPKNPTWEDEGYEAIFVAQLGVHARRLLRNKEELLRLVRKEQIPAWVIWEAVDRRMKRMERAEIGNVNDKHILNFGPYVDVVNVDKRIADLLRQASSAHPLLGELYQKVPKRRGLKGLVEHLRRV